MRVRHECEYNKKLVALTVPDLVVERISRSEWIHRLAVSDDNRLAITTGKGGKDDWRSSVKDDSRTSVLGLACEGSCEQSEQTEHSETNSS